MEVNFFVLSYFQNADLGDASLVIVELVHDHVINLLVSVNTLSFLGSDLVNEFIRIGGGSVDEEISTEYWRRRLEWGTCRLWNA